MKKSLGLWLALVTLAACSSTSTPPPSPTNQNPAIALFQRTPTSGVAPLGVVFSWSISDPNSDALTCKLDTNNDGTFEYTLTGCTSSSTQNHTYSSTGSFTAKLRVEDGKGGFAEQNVGIAVNTPNPNPTLKGEVTISKVEWGQSVFKSDLRLVAGKPALLRVHLLGDKTGLPGSLQGSVYLNNAFQGSLSFSGPATLPTAEAPADLTQSYRATVPANWVQSGLEVRIQADPNNDIGETDEAGNAQSLKPTVGTATVLYLTLVPVLQQGQTVQPTLPKTDLLYDMFPLKEVQANTRAAFSYGGTVTNSSSDWSNLLSALRNLRTADVSNRYYYGVVKAGYSSGIAGIGYIGLPVSAGWDGTNSAPRIMAHEVGHNMGRGHAPCGTTGEAGYPYPEAWIGSWGYSLLSATLYDPAKYKDVMSYCSPQWISDYNYSKLQDFLEASPPKAQTLSAAQEVLLVSGKIRGGQVQLDPLIKIKAVPDAPKPGSYALKLQTDRGTVEVPFSSYRVAAPHGPDQAPDESWAEEHFAFSIPDVGALQSLQVTDRGQVMLQRSAQLKAQTAPTLSLNEQNDFVELQWDNRAYPYAAIAHLGQERTTLGIWLQGGQARLSTQGLPAGGRFEVALSDGVNTWRQELGR